MKMKNLAIHCVMAFLSVILLKLTWNWNEMIYKATSL